MKKNLSSVTVKPPILSVRGVNNHQQNRKVQGFDKLSSVQSFKSKVQKIKNRPKNQSLEDQYVKGLQDQIHYLELELKLLKEQQVAKHSQVDQLETFFGDGISINQNILGLKNGFYNYKTQVQKSIATLQSDKKQREQFIQSLSSNVAELSKQIHSLQKAYKQSLTTKSDITHEKIKTETMLHKKIQTLQEMLKNLKSQNKKMVENIGGLNRAKELMFVTLMKIQSNKYNTLNKLRDSVTEKNKQLDQLGKKYEQLKKQEQQKTYVLVVQEDNLKLKRKIISLQKQLNSLKIKVEQKNMQLEAKLKQRQKQIKARMQMQSMLDQTKQLIDRQNNMSLQQLQKIANQRAAILLQKIVDKNKKLSKYVEYYGNLLSKVDQNIYELGQKRPELKSKIQINQNQLKILQKQLQKQKIRQWEVNSQLAKLKSKSEHIRELVPPIIQDIKKQKDKIRAYTTEKQKLLDDIKLKQKQLQLMQMIKSLSLEQAQISSNSNASIQDLLLDFMHSWESLNRQ